MMKKDQVCLGRRYYKFYTYTFIYTYTYIDSFQVGFYLFLFLYFFMDDLSFTRLL